jgi:hypothetical protein
VDERRGGGVSISPFFSYFGGKWRLAPRYPKPRTGTIIEPFAGSAGYATRHHHCRVILVERDPTIAGIWRYLLSATAAKVMRLPDLEPGQKVSDLDIEPVERALIGMWVSMAVTSPRNSRTSWADQHDQRRNGQLFWGRTTKARIATQLDKVRHWQLIEGTYADAPDIDGDWFIDPPYETMGKHYRFGADGIDFSDLGAWCRSRRGQVMVCENAGASWLPFKPFHTSGSAYGETAEVIWTNDAEAQATA